MAISYQRDKIQTQRKVLRNYQQVIIDVELTTEIHGLKVQQLSVVAAQEFDSLCCKSEVHTFLLWLLFYGHFPNGCSSNFNCKEGTCWPRPTADPSPQNITIQSNTRSLCVYCISGTPYHSCLQCRRLLWLPLVSNPMLVGVTKVVGVKAVANPCTDYSSMNDGTCTASKGSSSTFFCFHQKHQIIHFHILCAVRQTDGFRILHKYILFIIIILLYMVWFLLDVSAWSRLPWHYSK